MIRLIERILTTALFAVIRLYQRFLSPLLGNVCRFEPTCSRYMVAAVEKYGLARGVWKGVGRVCRCHPWNPGGFDPP
ncbi:MAG: membrane protein insertion efficiency factor YidD [Isosphaeraceae bacterium]|nr:membrane protein insertion efficiency factor YidD [Isosphaeraceae bacterium]